jgi:hypothetical protein
MQTLSIQFTESPAPVAAGLRILARAILGLVVLRADALESLADPHSVESRTRFYVAVDGQAHNAGTADSPWDIESALAGVHVIPPGSTVYLKKGTYRHADRRWESPGFAIALAGAPGRPVHIRPVPGHRVTLDGKVEVKPSARHLCVWELEITVLETAAWDRRVTAGGMKVDSPVDLPQGGLNILGGADSKFIHLVIHDMNSGIGFWRPAVDAEIHGCLVYGVGAIGPDRYHGPGIYTQNETGTKALTDNILFGNYSTTIQAYGSSSAPVSGFRIEGNIAFAPVKEGDRQRVLIGGGQPSRRIIVTDNILYEVPLELGYNAPHNEDAVVTGNWIVDAGLSINRFEQVTESGNTVIPRGSQRPGRPADIILRPSHYVPGRANLAIFNWAKRSHVKVDLSTLLEPGQPFSIVSALDFYGNPLVTGHFDGRPVPVPMPSEPRTGNGEFCAFIVLPGNDYSVQATGQSTSTAHPVVGWRRDR